VVSILLPLLLAAAQAPQAEPAPALPGLVEEGAEVEGVVITIARPDRLLSVSVAGEAGVDTLVASVPRGVYCGAHPYRYTRGPVRLCWLRARRKTEVLLRALAPGTFGRDWTTEWSGCEPLEDRSWCRVRLDRDQQVSAVFRRLPG
jgi:hypothetical protein